MAVGLGLAACDDPDELEALELQEQEGGPRPEVARPSLDLAAERDPHAQVAGFELDIAKDDGDIALWWTEQADATTYEVWTSHDAYFAPGDAGSERLAEGLVTAAYTHVAGNDATSRYYRVRVGTDPQQVSTTVGKLATPLEPGYTKLGLCLASEVDTAAALFADMQSPVISAHMWNVELQDWVWTWSATPVELAMSTGQVVSVRHDEEAPVEPTTYTMVGRVPVHGDVRLELLPGDNLVTLVPSRSDLHSASEVLAAVEHATRVGRWEAQTQTTHWYPDEPDFAVSACMPLHVEVSEPSTWPPTGYRRVIGPEGGTIEAFDGAVVLQVPAGALAEAVELRITPYEYAVGGVVIPTLALEPHDIPFAVPVTLTKRYRAAAVAPSEIDEFAALTRYSTDGTVTVLDAINDVEAGTLTASLDTFSYIDQHLPCNVDDPYTMAIEPSVVAVQAGQIAAVTAEAYTPAGALVLPTWPGPVSWTVDDASVADVGVAGPFTADGQVEGVAPGLTDVTAALTTCRLFYDDVFGSVVAMDAWPLSDAAAVSVPSCAELVAQGLCPANGCTGGCSNGVCDPAPANVGWACQTDGNACTNQACANVGGAGECVSNGFIDCNDGNGCTWDGCNPGSGCTHGPVPNACGCDSTAETCLLLSFTCGPFYALCAGLCYAQYNDCRLACGC